LQIRNQLVFLAFLRLDLGDKVPDAKTLWLFQEELKNGGVEQELFEMFNAMLSAKRLNVKGGHIVDATFVETPRHRNTREENAEIKAGI
jgi:IS5 family transposase